MMRIAMTFGTAAALAAGALALFRLAGGMTGRGQGQQAKPT
ncbi:hypothetical protein [Methylobacterium indicum]|nr:hypothetical protein [Methylobacterium indicum]